MSKRLAIKRIQWASALTYPQFFQGETVLNIPSAKYPGMTAWKEGDEFYFEWKGEIHFCNTQHAVLATFATQQDVTDTKTTKAVKN